MVAHTHHLMTKQAVTQQIAEIIASRNPERVWEYFDLAVCGAPIIEAFAQKRLKKWELELPRKGPQNRPL